MCTYIIIFLFINLKPDTTLRLKQNKIFLFFSFLAPVQRFVLYCLFTTTSTSTPKWSTMDQVA